MPQSAIQAFTLGAAVIGEQEAALRGTAGVAELLRYQAAWTHCSDEQKAIIKDLFVGWGLWPTCGDCLPPAAQSPDSPGPVLTPPH
jgi:hypothetical protein